MPVCSDALPIHSRRQRPLGLRLSISARVMLFCPMTGKSVMMIGSRMRTVTCMKMRDMGRATAVLTAIMPGRIPRDGRNQAREDEHRPGDRLSRVLIHRIAVETKYRSNGGPTGCHSDREYGIVNRIVQDFFAESPGWPVEQW